MLLTLRIALAAILLLLCTSAQSQRSLPSGEEGSQTKSKSARAKEETAQCQRGAENCPVTVKISPTPKDDAQAAQDVKERKEKSDLDRKLVDFNGDLAYYTKMLAWLAGLQFLALAAQVIFLRLAFRESRRTADTAREAMIAGERAFVFATGINPQYSAIPGTELYSWRFRPVWRNSGDTPTKNMRIYVQSELRDTALPKGFDFNQQKMAPGNVLLAPQLTVNGGAAPSIADQPPITPQDILEMYEGRKFLYLWGWAKYFDVFPGTKEHITRFCFLITPAGDPMEYVPPLPGGRDALTFPFLHHPEGNCADEECG